MPTATKEATESGYKPPTVAQIEAMSKTDRKKALITENAAIRRATEAGEKPPKDTVAQWINNPKNAQKAESAPKNTARRVNFAVIPYPKGKNAYDLEKQTFACLGTPKPDGHKPGAVLPIRSFPTTTPDKRTGECRQCRDFRQGRAERETAKQAEANKAQGSKKAASKASEAPKKASKPRNAAPRSSGAKKASKPSQGTTKAVSTRASRARQAAADAA